MALNLATPPDTRTAPGGNREPSLRAQPGHHSGKPIERTTGGTPMTKRARLGLHGLALLLSFILGRVNGQLEAEREALDREAHEDDGPALYVPLSDVPPVRVEIVRHGTAWTPEDAAPGEW